MAKSFDFQAMSTTMPGVVQESFKKFLKDEFSTSPSVNVNSVFMNDFGGMEASGLRKFHGRSYVSAVYFYLSEKHAEKKETCGTIVVYLRESVVFQLVKATSRLGQNEKITEEILLNASGEFSNTLAENLKKNLTNLGYKDLFVSPPEKRVDLFPEGVKVFDKGIKSYQEFSFYLWDVKAIVVDVIMSEVPRR